MNPHSHCSVNLFLLMELILSGQIDVTLKKRVFAVWTHVDHPPEELNLIQEWGTLTLLKS